MNPSGKFGEIALQTALFVKLDQRPGNSRHAMREARPRSWRPAEATDRFTLAVDSVIYLAPLFALDYGYLCF